MEYRIFFLNRETCLIHYPKQPNGFGILIISNDDKFTDQNESKWLLNQTRFAILRELVECGYTIYYTNLGGNHMGNPKAIEQVRHLYEYVKRSEILNDKVHVIAEGFGAIIAINLMKKHPGMFRSALFINPIFSLVWVKDMVQGQPFFYKKFLMDVSEAFEIPEEKCEGFINKSPKGPFFISLPFKIVHILEHGPQNALRLKLYRTDLPGAEDHIHVLLPEKRGDIANLAKSLFAKAECHL